MERTDREVFAEWIDAMYARLKEKMDEQELPFYSLALELPSTDPNLCYEMVLKITKKESEK